MRLEPPRLSESHAPDTESDVRLRTALRAARAQLPDAARVAALRASLGALPPPSPPPLTGGGTGAAVGGGIATLKVLSLLIGLGVVGLGAWSLRTRPAPRVVAAPVARESAPAVRTPKPIADRPAVAAAVPDAADVADVADRKHGQDPPTTTVVAGPSAPRRQHPPAAPGAPVRGVRPRVHPPRAAAHRASVQDELSLLQQAQAAVEQRPAHALSLLARHRADYPDGVFAQERQSLTFDALRKLGYRDRALAVAREFVARFPRSPHRRRFDAWLQSQQPAQVPRRTFEPAKSQTPPADATHPPQRGG